MFIILSCHIGNVHPSMAWRWPEPTSVPWHIPTTLVSCPNGRQTDSFGCADTRLIGSLLGAANKRWQPSIGSVLGICPLSSYTAICHHTDGYSTHSLVALHHANRLARLSLTVDTWMYIFDAKFMEYEGVLIKYRHYNIWSEHTKRNNKGGWRRLL